MTVTRPHALREARAPLAVRKAEERVRGRVEGPRPSATRLCLSAFGAVVVAVLLFTRGWTDGRLTLDGPGVALHLRLALDDWLRAGTVPYWLDGMWAGTPAWAVAPSLPTLKLIPFALLVGPETATRASILAAQVAAGWGAYVFAASLWGRRTPAPVAAAVIYALHPIVISHGALFGHETSLWVMASIPWLAWSFLRALRDDGAGYVAVTGLIAGFAVLHQAEHAYALVVLCACLLAVEVTRARHERGRAAVRPILLRAGAAAGIGLASMAFWLLPFLATNEEFVLTPPADSRASLTTGGGSALGRHPAAWLTRSDGLEGVPLFDELVVDLDRVDGLMNGAFYLGWVCVGLTVVSIVLVLRHDGNGRLTAVLLASALCIWLSTGGVPLATSNLVTGKQLLPLALVGGVTGVLLYGFLRNLGIRRMLLAGAVAGAFLLAMPYATPFLLLQRLVPFMANLRFPRFYPLAVLGLALGAAFPIVALRRWALSQRPDLTRVLSVAPCLVIIAAFLVDAAPYRSYYHLRPPDGREAYRHAAENLAAVGSTFRVTHPSLTDPRPTAELLATGQRLSVGWPHPLASKQLWRLTAEPFVAPRSFRDAAFGLSGTAYTAEETLSPSEQEVTSVVLTRNPAVLPIVRSYDSVVVVDDNRIIPELAVTLASRHVGVVAGGDGGAGALSDLIGGVVRDDACEDPGARTLTDDGMLGLAHDVAMACALHSWVGVYNGLERVPVGRSGAVFRAPNDGLRGIAVWLDRPPETTELVVRTVEADGSLGPEVVRTTGVKTGEDDMTTFDFAPLERSAGQRYLFSLSCPRCNPGEEPRMVVADAERAEGNLHRNHRVDRNRVVAFSLLYDGMAPREPSATVVRAGSPRPGRWDIETSGAQASVVVVADAKFDGWRARVDGQPVPLLTVDGAFMGVAVPPGRHQVTLSYRKPLSAWAGLAITLATLIGIVVSARRRRLTSARAHAFRRAARAVADP